MNYEDLSIEKKILLLTSEDACKNEGAEFGLAPIASLQLANFEQTENTSFAFAEGMLDTWNCDLAKDMSMLSAKKAKSTGQGAVILPPLALRSNLSTEGMSEDGCQIGNFTASYVRGVESGGLPAIIGDFGIKKSMLTEDKLFNEKLIADSFLKPLRQVESEGTLPAVIYNENDDKNFELSSLIEQVIGIPTYSFCSRATAKNAVLEINKGRRILQGDTFFVQNAYKDGLICNKEATNGTLKERHLRRMIRNGDIVLEDKIDDTLRKSIRYFKQSQNLVEDSYMVDEESLQSNLAEESIVLLKNKDNILPIAYSKSIAVVGHSLSDEFSYELSRMSRKVEFFDGYVESSEEEITLSNEQLEQIGSADIIIFMIDNERGGAQNCNLPANRLAVLDRLSSLNKPMIAIVLGNNPLSMAFDEKCNGVFLSRCVNAYTGKALCQCIYGEVNPSGRLSVTYYDDAEEYFSNIKRDRMLTKTQKANFFGYRYYDGSGYKIKYPFGHGLSYSNCKYVISKCNENSVEINVTNQSNFAVKETIQIYLSRNNSSFPHPRKELIAFAKVLLRANASTLVTIPLPRDTFMSYSVKGKTFVVEDGSYTVYVGKSVSNLVSKFKLKINGEKLPECNKTLADFLPWKSNIESEGYTMEEGDKLMKNSKKLSITANIMLFSTLLFDLVFALLGIMFFKNINFNDVLTIVAIAVLIFNHIIMITAIAIISNVKKRNKQVESLLLELKAKRFENATVVKSDSAKEIFDEEFDENYGEDKDEEVAQMTDSYVFNFDKNLKMITICEEMKKYLLGKGYSLNINDIRAIVSSFASSRLILTKRNKNQQESNLFESICEFFSKSPFVSFSIGGEDTGILENETCLSTIEYAMRCPNEMGICFMTNIMVNRANSNIAQVLPYLNSFENGKQISYVVGGNDKKIIIPPNVWFVLEFGNDEVLSEISTDLLNCAEVLLLKPEEVEEATDNQKRDTYVEFNQFITMVNLAEDKFVASEEAWKKLDKFEQSFSEFEFSIDNKDWQAMEKYAGVYLSSEGDENDMLDYVVAEKIIPQVSCYANELSKQEKTLLEVVESSFGEENVEKISLAIKEFAIAKQNENEEDSEDTGE